MKLPPCGNNNSTPRLSESGGDLLYLLFALFLIGGVKDSGFGRFGGSAVIDEFTDLRWITVQSGSHPFPF